jgi:FAD/FMN-containing dehydrogenase
VRDAVLELRVATAQGRPVTAGGPTVKNVSGFDVPRLLVGSLGTLALIGQAVLRTRPIPERSVWLRGEGDPFDALSALHRPTSLLWDGATSWVLLEGAAAAVADQARVARALGIGTETDGPPPVPPHRWSMRPRELRAAVREHPASIAEVGVGLLHTDLPAPPRRTPATLAELHRRLKERFDPTGRLNPGRSPLVAT